MTFMMISAHAALIDFIVVWRASTMASGMWWIELILVVFESRHHVTTYGGPHPHKTSNVGSHSTGTSSTTTNSRRGSLLHDFIEARRCFGFIRHGNCWIRLTNVQMSVLVVMGWVYYWILSIAFVLDPKILGHLSLSHWTSMRKNSGGDVFGLGVLFGLFGWVGGVLSLFVCSVRPSIRLQVSVFGRC